MRLLLKGKKGWEPFERVKKEDLAKRGIRISTTAEVGDWTRVGNNVSVCDGAKVGKEVYLEESSIVGINATVCDRVAVGWKTLVGNWAYVGERSLLCGDVVIRQRATIGNRVHIGNFSSVGEFASVGEMAILGDRVFVGAGTKIGDWAILQNGVSIKKTSDCVVLGPIGSRSAMLTGYFHKGEVWCATGCFCGPVDEFLKAVKKKHVGTIHEADYRAACRYIRERIKISRRKWRKGRP